MASRTAPQKILHGRISASIQVFPPDRRRRDLDNILKPVLDLLVHAGIIIDDENIDRILVERGETTSGGEVVVVLEEI